MQSSGTRIFRSLAAAFLVLAACAPAALGIDIVGVREASLDQPRINALVQPVGGSPYTYENFFGQESFNLFVFLDTGASGIVISRAVADELNLPREPGVDFHDVGVGGTTEFDVSPPLTVRLAPYTETGIDNINNYQTIYNQANTNVRLQIGPTNISPDPLAPPLDVFGMPVMMGKTTVMDPTPVNDLSDLMHTYIYEQGTPFNPAQVDTNPGIPTTSHHVKLSYGDFGRFTETVPAGAAGPTIAHNPFIGPDPLRVLEENPAPDATPPVKIGFGGRTAEGSFLLDTGAAASFISTSLAEQLGVRYAGGFNGDDPQLEIFDPAQPGLPGTPVANQFFLPIQGIGGVVTLAGFFLDEMLLHTLEGSLLPEDPNNIRFVGAPVLVHDIEVFDPITEDSLVLDGVFGMNFMAPSIAIDFGDARESPFRWITFDEPNGILGLDLGGLAVPEPSTYALAGMGLAMLVATVVRKRRARRR